MKKKKIILVKVEKVIKLSDGTEHTVYKVLDSNVQDSRAFIKGGNKND